MPKIDLKVANAITENLIEAFCVKTLTAKDNLICPFKLIIIEIVFLVFCWWSLFAPVAYVYAFEKSRFTIFAATRKHLHKYPRALLVECRLPADLLEPWTIRFLNRFAYSVCQLRHALNTAEKLFVAARWSNRICRESERAWDKWLPDMIFWDESRSAFVFVRLIIHSVHFACLHLIVAFECIVAYSIGYYFINNQSVLRRWNITC